MDGKAVAMTLGGLVLISGGGALLARSANVELNAPHELGIVDGHGDRTVVAVVANRTMHSVELLPEPSCCALPSSGHATLGPFQSKAITFQIATHKFPLGKGSTDLVVPYRAGGILRAAKSRVWYEVRR